VTPRGGPQLIPRPPDALPGGPPPWSVLPPADRRIDLPELAARLRARGPGRAVMTEHRPPAEDGRRSAVLVALWDDGDGPHVLLTRRSPHLRSHRWEVSFPGGGHDPEDRSLWHTALREAEEEVGLDPTLPEPVGELDRFVTVGSRSLVHPFVAVLPGRPEGLRAAPEEVEAILHVPLEELLLDEVFREERWPIAGAHRPITFFELVGDTIWGATAAMLRQLLGLATGTLR
jgi:8-oxo-dGTP pyrophosphatase MutT (NUDIX family)